MSRSLVLAVPTALAALLLLATPQSSDASQVFLEEIPLERVVESSTLIVEAKPSIPTNRTRQHDIALSGNTVSVEVRGTTFSINISAEQLPTATAAIADNDTYTSYSENFVVTRVIAGSAKKKKPLCVYPSSWSSTVYAHLSYYFQGMSESPIVMAYRSKSQAKIRDNHARILFLNEGPDGCATYAVNGGYEHRSKRRRVRSILRKLNKAKKN